jgi:hypothetical protein
MLNATPLWAHLSARQLSSFPWRQKTKRSPKRVAPTGFTPTSLDSITAYQWLGIIINKLPCFFAIPYKIVFKKILPCAIFILSNSIQI